MSTAAAGRAFRRFWQSETGPRTVHFWAPTLKWGLVIAGISDMQRPVERVSGTQNLSLMATAVIWTRWSFVIRPKNYLLASVNFFLGLTASYQLARIAQYRLREGDSVGEVLRYVVKGPRDPAGAAA
ncbi:AaceriAEL210Cp [[Ashbya] aceris (nom. inval.)]|nr:AaceriAEL210Cp [[Ashbya] aceris (nom. inval.)]